MPLTAIDRRPIYELTLRSLEVLFNRGCSLVVMACNTAAAAGLRQLQQAWLPFLHPSRRVIGVVVPIVEAITGKPWAANEMATSTVAIGEPLRVAIFATAHTVQTRAYVSEIGQRAPHIQVAQKACPELVSMIENHAPHSAIRAAVRRYVRELLEAEGTPDICVLGCPHYPLIEDYFVAELPAQVELLSQPDVTAKSLTSYLRRHPEFRNVGIPHREYLTTGDAAHVSALATRFYGHSVQFGMLADTDAHSVRSFHTYG